MVVWGAEVHSTFPSAFRATVRTIMMCGGRGARGLVDDSSAESVRYRLLFFIISLLKQYDFTAVA
jgi:hypothetical protein